MIQGIYEAQVASLMEQLRDSQVQRDLINSDTNRPPATSAQETGGFGQYIGEAVSSVNRTQLEAGDMRDAYERGEEIPLTDVVLAMQKSSLAFEATLQVRNKLLKAYEDIKSMPV